jgi:hypothetical protein
MHITVIKYPYVPTCFLLVAITISEQQVVPLDVEQCIIVKFLTNQNVKPAEILMRIRAQFDNETLPRTQLYDWSKSFKEGRTEVGNMVSLHLQQGKTWPAFFGTIKAFY